MNLIPSSSGWWDKGRQKTKKSRYQASERHPAGGEIWRINSPSSARCRRSHTDARWIWIMTPNLLSPTRLTGLWTPPGVCEAQRHVSEASSLISNQFISRIQNWNHPIGHLIQEINHSITWKIVWLGFQVDSWILSGEIRHLVRSLKTSPLTPVFLCTGLNSFPHQSCHIFGLFLSLYHQLKLQTSHQPFPQKKNISDC